MVDYSCAQFLAVAEHRLIPSRARSVCHQLRKVGHQSVWSPVCQDQVAGGHAGVGVVSLAGAPLSLPSFITPQFMEFFRLGRAMGTALPTGQEGVHHLFVVYGYQETEDDSDQLLLTDKLLLWLRLMVIWMPILPLSLVLLRVFLLGGLLIWHCFFSWGWFCTCCFLSV